MLVGHSFRAPAFRRIRLNLFLAFLSLAVRSDVFAAYPPACSTGHVHGPNPICAKSTFFPSERKYQRQNLFSWRTAVGRGIL